MKTLRLLSPLRLRLGTAACFIAATLSGCGSEKRNAAAGAQHPGLAPFVNTCAGCHMMDGAGLPGLFPPLAGSPIVQAEDPTALILIALHGLEGPVEVAGQFFDGVMPAQGHFLSDRELAAIVSYIRQEWGDRPEVVTPSQVQALRTAHPRLAPWTTAELSRAIYASP